MITPTSPTPHKSDSPLVRHPTSATTHKFDSPLMQPTSQIETFTDRNRDLLKQTDPSSGMVKNICRKDSRAVRDNENKVREQKNSYAF